MKLYEKQIYNDQNTFAISEKDQKWLIKNGANADLIHPFHRNESIRILKKTDEYVLYDGYFNFRDNDVAAFHFFEVLSYSA